MPGYTLDTTNGGLDSTAHPDAKQFGLNTGSMKGTFNSKIDGTAINEAKYKIKYRITEDVAEIDFTNLTVFNLDVVDAIPGIRRYSTSGKDIVYGGGNLVKTDNGLVIFSEDSDDQTIMIAIPKVAFDAVLTVDAGRGQMGQLTGKAMAVANSKFPFAIYRIDN